MLRKRRVGSIDGLMNLLNQRIAVAAIKATKADVEASNSESTVPSTKAIVEVIADYTQKINDVQGAVGGIIDDTADSGNNITWSIDRIRSFVASVDDSVVFADLSERDSFPNPFTSLIGYVIDTTGDSSLGNKEGQAAAYIYVEGEGWRLLSPLAQDIDQTVFVKYSDIIDDLTTGGSSKPLSAEQGKVLKQLIDEAADSHDAIMHVDNGLAITGDAFSTTYTPLGDIVGLQAEVEVSTGVWDVVDIAPNPADGSGPKDFVVLPENSGDYDGKTCRVSYMRDANEQ